MKKRNALDFSGNTYTWSDLILEIKKYEQLGCNIYIGSDSQVWDGIISLVTAICPHKPGFSGKVFYFKEVYSLKFYPNLKSRMFLEAYSSLEVAQEIQEFSNKKIEVHLDIGNTNRSKTSAYEKELQSMLLAQGFKCAIKPNSFASYAADKALRGFFKPEVVSF
jgi:predicted RNase H-related nuclease YkuK (DUF458 family)